MILKPFLLYEVIIVFLDYIRLYLVAGLAFRNPAGLGLLALAFIAFVWACMILFNSLVLKYRRDLRISYMTIFVFPFYKVCVFSNSHCFFYPQCLLSSLLPARRLVFPISCAPAKCLEVLCLEAPRAYY